MHVRDVTSGEQRHYLRANQLYSSRGSCILLDTYLPELGREPVLLQLNCFGGVIMVPAINQLL